MAANQTLIGPFTGNSVAELLFRVKSIEVYGSGASVGSDDGSEVLDLWTDDEIELFEGNALNYLAADGFGIPNFKYFSPLYNLFSPGGQFSDHSIFVDENGFYWLAWRCELLVPPYVSNTGYVNDITASLVLATGTYSIPMVTSSDYSLVTLTATAWLPYKTTAGEAAWDTATGLPINGGPGA